MSDEEQKYDKEFFKHLIDKVNWKDLTDVCDNHRSVLIALLLELNLNMVVLIKMLSGMLGTEEDAEKVRCPICIKDVIPDGLGYCPECKKRKLNTDLARIYPDKIHLGKGVDS